jgi:hypothetical protein
MRYLYQKNLSIQEIPYIFENQNILNKAKDHLDNSDYKAAAVYTRSAFEKIIRNHCEKKKKKLRSRQN